MGDILFYHLTRSALAPTLATLLEKSLERGWRCAVRGTDPAGLDALDAALWLGPEERFLPHGLAGGAHDLRQPILLTTATEAPNARDCLMAIESAPVTPDEAQSLQRTCILFDGANGAHLAHARTQWKTLTAAGLKAQYWSEDSGRWAKKAESG